jgi:hypothetical protein
MLSTTTPDRSRLGSVYVIAPANDATNADDQRRRRQGARWLGRAADLLIDPKTPHLVRSRAEHGAIEPPAFRRAGWMVERKQALAWLVFGRLALEGTSQQGGADVGPAHLLLGLSRPH